MIKVKKIDCVKKFLDFLYQIRENSDKFTKNQNIEKLKDKIIEDLEQLIEICKN